MDEYTSKKNQHYLNINIHEQNQHFNLGLIRKSGLYPAKRLPETLDHHLYSFGLSLEGSVICVVTDGAAVIKKMGKLLNTEHQLCYAHALHLAVCDLIYKHEDVDISDEVLDAEDNIENKGLQIETNEVAMWISKMKMTSTWRIILP